MSAANIAKQDAVEIAKQMVSLSARLAFFIDAESGTDLAAVHGHLGATFAHIGAVLSIISERVAKSQAEATVGALVDVAGRIVEPDYTDHDGSNFAIDLDERLNERQRTGYACIYCDANAFAETTMARAGFLAGGALWRCQINCVPPDTSTTSPAYVPDELVNVVLRQRGLAGLFADTDKIRGELAEILVAAKALKVR